jgi:nucleoside-diphosphate-sugar epimerase
MLQNLLDALASTGTVQQMKRIVLVAGGMHYGLHLGRPKMPMREEDPWLRQEKWGPNFYYRQQDIVHAYCMDYSHVHWTVTYPNDVIGFAKDNFMNLATALALYAVVSKELDGELVFPGSLAGYSSFGSFTDSRLHAEFAVWAALNPKTSNQAFNVVNGDVESWENLWPQLAKRFGLKVKEDQFVQVLGNGSSQEMNPEPPLSTVATQAGLVGTIKPSKTALQVDLIRWSQREEVKIAWGRLAEREGLEKDAFDKATWGFLNSLLGRDHSVIISMSKARSFGWHG